MLGDLDGAKQALLDAPHATHAEGPAMEHTPGGSGSAFRGGVRGGGGQGAPGRSGPLLGPFLGGQVSGAAGGAAGGAEECRAGGDEFSAWWARLVCVRSLMVWRLDDINEHLALGKGRRWGAGRGRGVMGTGTKK